MSDNPQFLPPKVTGADDLHVIARSALSMIPLAGGTAKELFNAIITPPIERRRKQWMESVGAEIENLRKADANVVERLRESEDFQSILLHASWAAVRNHQQEKLQALKNAVLNAAHGVKVSEDLQLLFVRYVDEMTPTHLFVMHFLTNYEQNVAHFRTYDQLWTAFSVLTHKVTDPIVFKLVCEDLKVRTLVRISDTVKDLPGIYDESPLVAEGLEEKPRIIVTDVGRSFVAFVLNSPTGTTSTTARRA